MHSDALLLGIDLGGTKSAALIGTPTGEILARAAGPTPAQEGPDVIIPFLIALAKEALDRSPAPVAGVGVSAGAPADARTGRVFEAPNLPGWGRSGVPLADILSRELGGLPVYLENDADATALAEHRYGAGSGTHTMAFLTVGTGIGAGLILDGKLHRGARGAGGEVGHIAVEPGGRDCLCGLRGCLEAYSSGPSIVRVAVEQGFSGEATGPAVIAAARSGDTAAVFAVEQAGRMLGRGLATLCMLLNPQRIVLGTLAVHAGDLLLPRIRETLHESAWPRLVEDVEIVPAALGDRAQDLAALCAFLHRE
jgi:glucokinase